MAEADGGARLFVLTGPDLGRSFPLGARATLGRSDECDIVLRDRSISRKHALLALEDGRWYAEDQGSTNGISKDGKRAKRLELADGDEFKLGDLLLRLRLGAESVPGAGETDIEFEAGPAPASAAATLAAAPSPARAPGPPPAPVRPPAASASDKDKDEVEVEMEIEIEEPGEARPKPVRSTLAPAAPLPPRAERRTGFFASDFEQQPFWLRMLLVLLLLALCGALAYGAYRGVGLLRGGE